MKDQDTILLEEALDSISNNYAPAGYEHDREYNQLQDIRRKLTDASRLAEALTQSNNLEMKRIAIEIEMELDKLRKTIFNFEG